MRILNSGMGGFLNPPGHAEHNWSIGDGNGSASLTYALTQPWVSDELKRAIRALLLTNPGTFTPEWEANCYAYFRNCYSPDGVQRNVSGLMSNGPPEYHAAYLHIKKFFPVYAPNLELIANPPKWGK